MSSPTPSYWIHRLPMLQALDRLRYPARLRVILAEMSWKPQYHNSSYSLLYALVDQGYVARQPDLNRTGYVLWSLTPAGRDLLAELESEDLAAA